MIARARHRALPKPPSCGNRLPSISNMIRTPSSSPRTARRIARNVAWRILMANRSPPWSAQPMPKHNASRRRMTMLQASNVLRRCQHFRVRNAVDALAPAAESLRPPPTGPASGPRPALIDTGDATASGREPPALTPCEAIAPRCSAKNRPVRREYRPRRGASRRECVQNSHAPTSERRVGIIKPHQELRCDRLRDYIVLKIFADDTFIRK